MAVMQYFQSIFDSMFMGSNIFVKLGDLDFKYRYEQYEKENGKTVVANHWYDGRANQYI